VLLLVSERLARLCALNCFNSVAPDRRACRCRRQGVAEMSPWRSREEARPAGGLDRLRAVPLSSDPVAPRL